MDQPTGPLELIVGVFKDQETASSVLKDVQRSAKQKKYKIEDAAVIVKDQNGEIKHRETQDVSAGKGALFGAVVGGAIGLLGGPIGAIIGAAAGATTGGVTAGKLDTGFADEAFGELQEGMKPGTSALMLFIRQPWSDDSVAVLESHDAEVFRHMLAAEVARKLLEEQNKDADSKTA